MNRPENRNGIDTGISQREYCVCFTGHRHLSSDIVRPLFTSLQCAIRDASRMGYTDFLSGAALGFDTLAAEAVLSLRTEIPRIRLILAIPCDDQSARWSAADQERYTFLKKQADCIIRVNKGSYFAGCMAIRNQYLVHHSSLCICYLTQFRGGTGQTVRFAFREGLPVWNMAMKTEKGKEDHQLLKEIPWNCISTFPSASENAHIAILSRFPGQTASRKLMWKRCWRKQRRGGRTALRQSKRFI